MINMRKFIISLLPIFVARFLAPYIGTLDNIGNSEYWRLYDDNGAGLLIKKKNPNKKS